MIALDTHAFVRLFVEDGTEPARRARRAVQRVQAEGDSVLVNDVVLAEAMWTLARSYKVTRLELARTVEAVFEAPVFAFESRVVLERAIGLFRSSAADFSDCLIVAKNEALGCDATLTFDRAAATLPSTQAP